MALTSKLSAIGDAIRSKTGGTELLTLDAMPGEIEGIQTGGDTSIEDSMITRYITEVRNGRVNRIGGSAFSGCESLTNADFPLVEYIGNSAFYGCKRLTSANFPAATRIDGSAFHSCNALTSANFPAVTRIDSSAFYNCYTLTSADFPAVTRIDSSAFYNCRAITSVNFPLITTINRSTFDSCYTLTSADFPAVTRIDSSAFNMCFSLTALILRKENVCTLSNANALSYCSRILGTVNSTYNPEGLKDGYIYVPDNLVDSYKTATNWSTYASQIKPLSEYAG